MPIVSFADYIPTLDEFIAHWEIVDATAVLTVPVAGVGVTLSDLVTLREDLDATKTELEGFLNTLEISRVTLNMAREVANARISEFNRRVRAQFPNAPAFSRLPTVPTAGRGRDAFLSAMDDALDLWGRINASAPAAGFSPPMLLQGGLTQAALAASRAAMDAGFTARAAAETQLAITRANRDVLHKNVLQILAGYRSMVQGLYPMDGIFVTTLPRLSPLPGHTPLPVAATAEWNEPETKAEIRWEASEDGDLQDYQLRAVPGPEYAADDATTLHTFSPADPREFLTGAGFATPGAAMTYKIFVRLTTGNEAGSTAVTVTRPL